MSSGSTESQYGLRHVNGVPVWDGDILTLQDYETAALWFKAGLKPGEQERAARLWANLQGPAKEVVRTCRPQEFENARGVERLFDILRDTALSHRCLCLTHSPKCTSRRATDGSCWNKKRDGLHRDCNTAAQHLGRPRPP